MRYRNIIIPIVAFSFVFSCTHRFKRQEKQRNKNFKKGIEALYNADPLDTVKVYSVQVMTSYGDSTEYFINNQKVNEAVYDKYTTPSKKTEDSRPYIVKTYDRNETLIKEAVKIQYREVDWFKTFYPNGKIKETGQYSIDIGKSSNKLLQKSFVKHGKWVYLKDNGDTAYTEIWNYGNFVKQIPQQNKTEIWKTELQVNNQPYDKSPIHISQFNNIEIIPYFKNSNRDSLNLTFDLEVRSPKVFLHSMIGIKAFKCSYPIDSIKTINFENLLLKNYFTSKDKINVNFYLFNNGKEVSISHLKVINTLPKSSIKAYRQKVRQEKLNESKDFLLVNSSDSTKKVKIKNKMSYELKYTDNAIDSLTKIKIHNVEGFIDSIKDSTIIFKANYESITQKLKDGTYSNSRIDYFQTKNPEGFVFKNIRLSELELMTYSSKSRSNLHSLSSASIFLSVLTTVIVAPLASINYKHGGFNTDRYFSIAGGGLIGLSVSIPVSLLTKPKTYKLTSKHKKRQGDYWYLATPIKN